MITWGIGHLVELKEPKAYDPRWNRWTLGSLPILPERYEFQVAKGKYAAVSNREEIDAISGYDY